MLKFRFSKILKAFHWCICHFIIYFGFFIFNRINIWRSFGFQRLRKHFIDVLVISLKAFLVGFTFICEMGAPSALVVEISFFLMFNLIR